MSVQGSWWVTITIMTVLLLFWKFKFHNKNDVFPCVSFFDQWIADNKDQCSSLRISIDLKAPEYASCREQCFKYPLVLHASLWSPRLDPWLWRFSCLQRKNLSYALPGEKMMANAQDLHNRQFLHCWKLGEGEVFTWGEKSKKCYVWG